MKGMVCPLEYHWLLLQRLASHLEQFPEYELFFVFQGFTLKSNVWVDSDWTGEADRKSIDGGFLFSGKHLLDGWAGQQGHHALSSGEAE